MADSQQEEWLEIGRIVAPQGLDGSVRVYPDSDFPERFLDPGDRWLQKSDQANPERVKLLSGRYLPGKGLYIIKLAGIDNREKAEMLRNARLLVARSDRLPVAPDEFHVADLIGLEVRLQTTGQTIGSVVDVFAAGNDLLAVKLVVTEQTAPVLGENKVVTIETDARPKAPADTEPVLIPFVQEIVPVVNLEGGYVEITPPKGLLPKL